MPIYLYRCFFHGQYEAIHRIDGVMPPCPICGKVGIRQPTSPARVKIATTPAMLPYGKGPRGKFISHEETGGMDIMIPSWGSMEKEEIDYVAEVAIEKEKDRVRKKREKDSIIKQKIATYKNLAYQTRPGERAKTLKEAIKEDGEIGVI